MSGPSQTLIVNMAVGLLGSTQRVSAINESSTAARLAASFWDQARDEMLADHPWNPAIARASLPASATNVPDPEGEYASAFELPGDCLRWLPWERSHPDWFAGEQEGNFILSSADAPIRIRYIRRLEDVGLWSPGMRHVMAIRLAAYMARGLTGRTSLVDRMFRLYDSELPKAKRQDGLATGRQSSATTRSSWLDARRRTGTPPL